MAGVGIANYWASVGVKTDDKALRDVDEYLRKIENKLKKGQSAAGKGLVLNVSINQRMLRKSIADTIEKGVFRAQITPVLNKSSLTAVRQQIQSLFTTPINVKVNVPKQTASSSGGSRSSSRKMDGYNQDAFNPNPWGGSKGGPSILERIRGRPEKGSLSAANRRYFDATGKSIFSSGNSITGWIGETLGGGLVSQGASTMAGRAGITLASSLGGMRAGGFVGAGLGLATLGVKAGGMAWTGLANVVTTPFRLIGSAAGAVTSAFYQIAMAAAPLVAGFAYINNTVQKSQQRQIALNTVSASLGSNGKTESNWLMNMANREGLKYNSIIDPFTTFIASASPAMGLPMAKNIFESFTQFGMTRGASDVSMQLAMRAVSQMAGKGKIQAEELRGQLGDAPGFGEMQGIFAEAYQRSLGRSGDSLLKGQKAIEELNKAMEKGNVYSAKVLPYVAEIAKRLAEPGLFEARQASFAEQARFQNQLSQGTSAFREGGGEKGLQFFWQMMQNFGQWFKDNGSELGNYFRILIVDLNTLRVGLKELFQFAWTGKSNDLVEIAKENGFDLPKIRDSLIQLFDSIGALVKQILKSLGFDTGNGLVAGLGAKILRFTEDLNKVFVSLTEMFKYLGTVFSEFGRLSEMSYAQIGFAASPAGVALGVTGAYNNPFVNIAGALSKAGAAFGQATVGAGTATVNALTQPGMTPQGNYNPITNPQLNLLPPSNPLQMYTPLMQNQLSTPQKLEGNVNITLTVEGNSDLAAQLNTPQVQSIIRKTTQEGISNMLLQAVPTAPIN